MPVKNVRPVCAESNPICSDPGTSARDRSPTPVSTGLSFSASPSWTWSQITQTLYPSSTQTKVRQLATNLAFLDQLHNEPHDAPLAGGVNYAQRIHDADDRQAYSEHMEQHAQSVAAMAALRLTVKTLTPDELHLPMDQFHALTVYLNQKINDLAPYYTQMGNINLLAGEGHRAWKRTCNVTSLSMALEGLGVGPTDFKGDVVLLQKIAAALEPWRFAQELAEDQHLAKLKADADKRNAKSKGKKGKPQPQKSTLPSVSPEDDWGSCYASLDNLRMPDFVQHVAVYVVFQRPHGSGKKKRPSRKEPEADFITDVLAARQGASAAVLSPETLAQIAGQFEGVTATFKYSDAQYSTYGVVNRDLNEIKHKEAAYVKTQLQAFQKQTRQKLAAGSDEEKEELDKIHASDEYQQLAKQQKENEAKLAPFQAELEKNINNYRRFVEKEILPKTEAGAQIVVNRPGHFMKLHSIDANGLIVDDPWVPGKRHQVKWRQAYEEGYFRDYIVLTR